MKGWETARNMEESHDPGKLTLWHRRLVPSGRPQGWAGQLCLPELLMAPLEVTRFLSSFRHRLRAKP